MVVAQVIGHRGHRTGGPVHSMAQQSLAKRQTGRHRHLVAMLTMDCNRNAGEPGSHNGLNAPPITGMHDRRTNLPHYPREPEDIKLKSRPSPSSMQNLNTRCPFAGCDGGITQSANVVLEQFGFKTADELHHRFLSSAQVQSIQDMHNAQWPRQTIWLASTG